MSSRAPRPPLLMSRDNPDGWTLEDLLEQVEREIQAKTDRLEGETHRLALFLRGNNRRIIENLRLARQMQVMAMEELSDIGPDEGPRGVPRLGVGSNR